jgi:hypothetical protein
MKQIVCMKWGNLYSPEYVNKLYSMTKRNIQGNFRFVCLTDNPEGIRPEVECLPCPKIDIPEPFNNTGWRKLTLWAKSLEKMTGSWLFMDLDVVITGNLDGFFEYQPDKTFIVMHNWTQPNSGIGNTSVFRFKVGSHPYLFDNILNTPLKLVEKYRNEQTFISKTISDIHFWPDEWCILFKTHCIPPMPIRWWKAPILPNTARVVAFPGDPNPDKAVKGIWPTKKGYKKIYKHIKPATWINDFWRE